MRTTFTAGVFAATLLAATSAMAHAELESSAPADGATIHAAPDRLELNFDEPVKLAAVTIRSDDMSAALEVDLAAPAAETVGADLPDLEPGVFTVEWRALGDDGHALNGELTFTLD